MIFHGKTMQEWIGEFPGLEKVSHGLPYFWWNPSYQSMSAWQKHSSLSLALVEDAQRRLERFAPLLVYLFPELEPSQGVIESPLEELPSMAVRLESIYGKPLRGKLLVKKDSDLPLSGSIKARGGFYEVLKHAEALALKEGLIGLDLDYSRLGKPPCRAFFSRHVLGVGSTGNLGLSIGIMGTALGFRVEVHMSQDAREWKKDLLRARGARVIEYSGDYSMAVKEGRRQAAEDPLAYFVDDEDSKDLFAGYATAPLRLAAQLKSLGIFPGPESPLFVYLPCGVGGAPGGITFGLKLLYGEDVHCFWAEPTQAPCALLGISTGLYNQVGVEDVGLHGNTLADGLAVGRMSSFVGHAVGTLVSGGFTVEDEELYKLLVLLEKEEGLFLEPSALAGFPGPWMLVKDVAWGAYQKKHLSPKAMERATHLVWATGGSMVPSKIREEYRRKGQSLA